MARTPGRWRRLWRGASLRRRILLVGLAGFAFGAMLLVGAWTRACANDQCPDITELDEYDPDQSTRIFAADGRPITDLGTEKRTLMALRDMSPAIPAAFLAAEDKRFYQHHGIDWWRIPGAIKANLTQFALAQGFSTITMQLVGNRWPDDINRQRERGLRGIPRKIRELKLARAIEARYAKDKILEFYLNHINLGSSAYGVEAASLRYFGKSASALNVAEAATLAALPKAPGTYNPRRNPRNSVQRRNTIIGLMRDEGLLTPEEAETWKGYPLALSAKADNADVGPYFVEYVRQQLMARLPGEINRGGYKVYTTLDLDVQRAAEKALEAQLLRIENDEVGKYPHKSYREVMESREPGEGLPNETQYLQGGALVMEAKTGNVLAMVGGRDFEDSKFNRMVQSLRQPGSTFKPIVYAAALEAGITLDQTEMDEPVSIPRPGEPNWEPQNFDGKFSMKPMTLREAIAQSTNSIAVRVGLKVGIEPVVAEARRFGLTGKVDRVPAIMLGAASILPIEMIASYSTFANLGRRVAPNVILRVEDRNGKIIPWPQARSYPVLDQSTAYAVNSALQGVVQHGTAYTPVARAGFNIPTGGKTGTTNDYVDVWYIGFTQDLVAGVWMGFDKFGIPIMPNAQGGRLAAPAWTQMMLEIYQRRRTPGGWAQPEQEVVTVEVDKANGFRATPFCPDDARETRVYAKGSEPKEFCPLHSPFRPGGGN